MGGCESQKLGLDLSITYDRCETEFLERVQGFEKSQLCRTVTLNANPKLGTLNLKP